MNLHFLFEQITYHLSCKFPIGLNSRPLLTGLSNSGPRQFLSYCLEYVDGQGKKLADYITITLLHNVLAAKDFKFDLSHCISLFKKNMFCQT